MVGLRVGQIKNNKGVRIDICSFGATIVNFLVPNKHGESINIVLGYDTLKSIFWETAISVQWLVHGQTGLLVAVSSSMDNGYRLIRTKVTTTFMVARHCVIKKTGLLSARQ